jgi:hypothetical protein
MSDETKEGFGLILEELREMRSNISDLQNSINGLRVVIVDHTRDEEKRFNHFSEALSNHSQRLKDLESSVRARMNGG